MTNLTELARALLERHQTPIHHRFTDAELAELIPRVVESAGQAGLTYNQVAARLDAHFAQVSRVLTTLAESPESPVYARSVQRGKRTHKLYFFQPERKRIQLHPEQTPEIVSALILALLRDTDAGCSEYQIRQHIKDTVQIGYRTVRACLQHLSDSGKITARTGPRNARLYSLV